MGAFLVTIDGVSGFYVAFSLLEFEGEAVFAAWGIVFSVFGFAV